VSKPGWTIPTLKEHFDVRFEALQEAVNKADAAYEKRMDTTNEWRAALTDQQATFVTKEQMRWAITALIAGVAMMVGVFGFIIPMLNT
jgi:biopolymer transport protein ExbB/TolQ